MIHGYHVIWGTYGFWMPNDPRGSWSDFVYAWELARFGRATKSVERVDVEPLEYAAWRKEARKALKYPPVTLDGEQARAVGEGFGRFVRKSGLSFGHALFSLNTFIWFWRDIGTRSNKLRIC